MRVIGVTGGVGAGKSTVLGILEEDFQERFSVVWDEVNDLKAAALKEKKDLTDKSDMIK